MRFVRALLKEFGGFTLLGDPAQGIYDFSLEDEADPEVDGSPALYSWLRETYDGSLVERSLMNHRACSRLRRKQRRLVRWWLTLLQAGERLWSLLRGAEPPSPSSSVCRQHGDFVSKQWRSPRVPQRFVATGSIIDSSDVRSIALSPLGGLVACSAGPTLLSRGQFETTLANLEGDVPDPDEVWGALRRAGVADGHRC